jgi:hypothetical protein
MTGVPVQGRTRDHHAKADDRQYRADAVAEAVCQLLAKRVKIVLRLFDDVFCTRDTGADFFSSGAVSQWRV